MKDDNIIGEMKGNSFLFVTSTDVEADALFSIMTPMPNKNKVIKVAIGNHTYYLGLIGHYPVVHVQCDSMGMINPGASITTTYDAISQWKPIAVIIVGIAFGIDKKKQRIGDVLVSRSIIDYESVKVGKHEKEYRNHNVISGTILFDRFKNMHTWNFQLPRGYQARTIFGSILSGEKLVDNLNFLDELKEVFPTAIGGEMESYGVFSACKNAGISEWIMIKGICDWANGQKSIQKKSRQQVAAKSAASLCLSVFSEDVFDVLCKPIHHMDIYPVLDHKIPRLPIIFLLDTSGSMAGGKISKLSSALVTFKDELLLTNIECVVDVSIITFSDTVRIVQNFTSIDKLQIPQLDAFGSTNMGKGISVAIQIVNDYIEDLKSQEKSFYKPFIIMITDGQATDDINHSVNLVKQYGSKFNFWIFGIDDVDYQQLLKFTSNVIKVMDHSFKEIFQWLGASISITSTSCGREDVKHISLPAGLQKIMDIEF